MYTHGYKIDTHITHFKKLSSVSFLRHIKIEMFNEMDLTEHPKSFLYTSSYPSNVLCGAKTLFFYLTRRLKIATIIRVMVKTSLKLGLDEAFCRLSLV